METLNTFYEDYRNLSKFVQRNHDSLFGSDKIAVLVQIFTGRCEQAFLARISAEITGLIPHVRIIGTTTSGEIMNGQISGLRTVLSFSVFHHSVIKSGFFPKSGEDDFTLGQKIASDLGSDSAKVLILFSTGLSVNAKDMLWGIHSVYPNLPIAGGNAGNNSLMETSFVLCDGQVLGCGVVGAALEGERLTVHCHSHLGWQPIGKEMTITKADGLRVYTIDHMPTYEVYRKYLGLDEIKNFSNVIEYPLIADRNGIQTARTPDVHYEDDSIRFAAELMEGEKARLSFGHVGMISEKVVDLCQKIKQQPAESIYVYSCECRRGFLQERSNIETEPLQKIAPTSGFFTHGEFFHAGAANQLLNATMTVLVLSELNGKVNAGPPVTLPGQKKPYEACTLHKDHVAERNTDVLKALTHLVNTVTDELVTANAKLKYVSLHDSLTGLYNRAFFEQEMKRLEHLGGQAGVIVCDLDFLKMINDVLGHTVGDKALKVAAEVIAKSCPEGGAAARIGGDEFAILLAHADMPMLADIRNRILTETASYRRIHPERFLYLSVGFVLKGHAGVKSMWEAFKAADANMYRHKSAGTMKARQEVIRNLIGKAKGGKHPSFA